MSDGNGFLGREEFLAPQQRRYATVTMPGFGMVRIQSLTEREKSDFETAAMTVKGGLSRRKLEEARRRLIVLCIVDANGNRLLTEQDMPTLENLDGAVSTRIYDECRRHCGFDEEDIETLVKNSEAIAGSVSPTD